MVAKILVAKFQEVVPGAFHGGRVDPPLSVFELLLVPGELLAEVVESLL
jgi:hypothetical protein